MTTQDDATKLFVKAAQEVERKMPGTSPLVIATAIAVKAIQEIQELVSATTATEPSEQNTPIEKLVAQYEAEECNFNDAQEMAMHALRYAETMPDSHARCLLYKLGQAAQQQAEPVGDEILPCPFCGSDEVTQGSFGSSYNIPQHYVKCEQCGGAVANHDTEAEALAAWNHRAAQSGQRAGVAVAKGEIWYVRLKGAGALTTLEMLEVTSATILAKRPGDYYETRYSRADVDFVELAAPTQQQRNETP
ncbi:MAG: Lar family restriction alleviation protein [Achromobacter mucicolens]